MLNELAREIHENAVEHGWWDEERSFGDIVALCHSELSEALEEYRAGHPELWSRIECGAAGSDFVCKHMTQDGLCASGMTCSMEKTGKPEGIAVEMADCIIRILDWCGKVGVDIDAIIRIKMEYNKTRPYRHGGKVL